MKTEAKVVLEPGSDASIAASRKNLQDTILKLAGKDVDADGNPIKILTPGEGGEGTVTPPVPPVTEPEVKTGEKKPEEPVASEADKTIADLRAKLAEAEQKFADIDARYKKANGDYGGTLEKQSNQIRELGEYVQTLQARMEKLVAENESLKKAATKEEEPKIPDDLIDEDLREISPKSAERIAKAFAAMQSRLDQYENGNKDTLKRAQEAEALAMAQAVSRYNEAVISAIPDAESVFSDSSYLAFIRTPDEFGRTLEQPINDAVQQLNPRPVIASVNIWKKSNTKEPTVEEKEAARKAVEAAEADKKAKFAAHGAPSAAAGAGDGKPKSPADEASKRKARIEAYERKRDVNVDSITKEEAAKYHEDLRAERDYKLAGGK